MLRHDGVADPHFDFLFEWEPGEPLTSFRCTTWPPTVGDAWEERPDHRPIYLEYEGPISGGRGVVARRAAGTIAINVITVDPPSLALCLDEVWSVAIAHEMDRGVWTVQAVSA